MIRRSITLFIVLVMILGVGISAAGAGTSAPPSEVTSSAQISWREGDEDLTGKAVKFYHFGDLSRIYAFITIPVLSGFEDAVAYFNEHGGVCGAEFKMDYGDTAASG